MIYRLALAGLATLMFATGTADAQVCQWTGKGGEDVTWVKLMWFERDTQSKEDPKPIKGFKSISRYKKYVGKKGKKSPLINPDLLRDWVPEIFGEGEDPKVDAYYFLSDAAFQPSEELKGQDTIPLSEGRKYEKGPKCALLGDKEGYIGYKKIEKMRDGKVLAVEWYSPIAIDMLNRSKKTDPLKYFGYLAGVLAGCIVAGYIGVKVGDKERALD